ncbi:uncharacterized protein LOC114744544 isoform X1 [Neltuma alba]|uniref:uncharacterized protein LOC114744544 isoform X1 n=1 Tax=Neltuma alba TaxID=207710 RepID=UPI0010A49544|nr:uncharacterized protein LOC114744544 isoform X1 [Prosopis alba]
MAEIPKLDSGSSSSEQNRANQKISVSDHMDAFQYTPEKSDNFVIDMDAFPSTINKDNNPNSRITLQRNLSRKGSQRGGDKKINGSAALHDRDSVPTTGSPKATLMGSCTPEKPGMVTVGSTDHSTNSQVHHQITITTSNISTTAAAATAIESKGVSRRNSFKRPSFRILDPRRVLLFFATLSSMGTMLLIYFTLAMGKQSDENGVDWQQ